jgi:hypothetical protein
MKGKKINTDRFCDIGGEIKEYFCCGPNKEFYDDVPMLKSDLKYLGEGTIHSIDGVEQLKGVRTFHFWAKR